MAQSDLARFIVVVAKNNHVGRLVAELTARSYDLFDNPDLSGTAKTWPQLSTGAEIKKFLNSGHWYWTDPLNKDTVGWDFNFDIEESDAGIISDVGNLTGWTIDAGEARQASY